MNNERLYFNNQIIELSTDSAFARTLQVNDLVSLDSRNSNFTKNIKIPKTPNNKLAFEFLGVVGNTTNLPYLKNDISYFVENEAIIYNGLGIINSTTDFYDVTIIDGNIDLYKAIENQSLSTLNLTGLTHSKNLTTVINSFSSTTLDYKYILANYNGKSIYDTNKINIDYLVPSVKISYLWDEVFNKIGCTYDGEIFDTDEFKNLYLTYPKSIEQNVGTTLLLQSGNTLSENPDFRFRLLSGDTTGDTLTLDTTKEIYTVNEDVTLSITIKHSLLVFAGVARNYNKLWLYKNGANVLIADVYKTGYLTEYSFTVSFTAGDTFSLYMTPPNYSSGVPNPLSYPYNLFDHRDSTIYLDGNLLDISISKYDTPIINFGAELDGLTIKDFLNEIIQRFGLSIYKDKYNNHYSFKTLSEILNKPNNYIDWSNKFQSVTTEKYIYGSYAQLNQFKYKYNADNANYNDGYIGINNANLTDSKVVIQSKIYSPEDRLTNSGLTLTTSGGAVITTNTYKIWNKEVKDDGSVTYKGLDKRYYLLRSNNTNLEPTTIGSEFLTTSTSITSAPVESFSRLTFGEIISDYYSDFSKILDNTKILNVQMNLNYLDISDFDFSKLYYIKQLGSYYLVNKINNFQLGKTTSVEMVKVDYFIVPPDVNAEVTYLYLNNIVSLGCTIYLEFYTDALTTTDIHVIGKPNLASGLAHTVGDEYYIDEIIHCDGTFTIVPLTLTAGNYWVFNLTVNGVKNGVPFEIHSGNFNVYNMESCGDTPPAPAFGVAHLSAPRTVSNCTAEIPVGDFNIFHLYYDYDGGFGDGTQLYTDSALTIPFVGTNHWYSYSYTGSVRINGSGIVYMVESC